MNSQEKRTEKIKRLWKEIHDTGLSYFLWENHLPMNYHYNEATDTIDCDCEINIKIDIPSNELTTDKLIEVIDNLELKIYNEYKKNRNIDLGYIPFMY